MDNLHLHMYLISSKQDQPFDNEFLCIIIPCKQTTAFESMTSFVIQFNINKQALLNQLIPTYFSSMQTKMLTY